MQQICEVEIYTLEIKPSSILHINSNETKGLRLARWAAAKEIATFFEYPNWIFAFSNYTQ